MLLVEELVGGTQPRAGVGPAWSSRSLPTEPFCDWKAAPGCPGIHLPLGCGNQWHRLCCCHGVAMVFVSAVAMEREGGWEWGAAARATSTAPGPAVRSQELDWPRAPQVLLLALLEARTDVTSPREHKLTTSIAANRFMADFLHLREHTHIQHVTSTQCCGGRGPPRRQGPGAG